MLLDERIQNWKKKNNSSLPLMYKFQTKSLVGFKMNFDQKKKKSILEEKIYKNNKKHFKQRMTEGFHCGQWLRIRLAMHKTLVQSLVPEDPHAEGPLSLRATTN